MQDQRHVRVGESQHPLQGTVLNSEGLSTLAVQPSLTQDSHGREIHRSEQLVKVAVSWYFGIIKETKSNKRLS